MSRHKTLEELGYVLKIDNDRKKSYYYEIDDEWERGKTINFIIGPEKKIMPHISFSTMSTCAPVELLQAIIDKAKELAKKYNKKV